ncbi:class II aldolase/adducin family protein [Paraburkholderia sediminicola]|uniref:class II aldolase/adducin family protein n=1 Tax=Paraburkholderia sediminicola TaxID=458836 RepID=UPI0038BA3ABC
MQSFKTSDPAAPPASVVADTGAAVSPASAFIDDLVVANHILFDHGIVDAFGHVSVRHDRDPDRFLLSRNLAPGSVKPEDIVEFDLQGDPVNAHGRSLYLERFIHSEIYKARPDVMAIVHSHSPAVLPFGLVQGVKFRPVCHMCGFLGQGAPVYEIRQWAGEATDLLIRSNALGRSLAETLGETSLVLMRGHGSTVVGPSLKQAVYRAIYAEVNARLQSEAMRLGPVTYLSSEEAETSLETVESHIERPWALWKARVVRD